MRSIPVIQPIPENVPSEEPAVAEAPARAAASPVRESRAAPAERVAPMPMAQSVQPMEEAAPPAANSDYFPAETVLAVDDPALAEPAAEPVSNPVIEAVDAIAWGTAGTLLLLALFAGPLRRRRPKEAPPQVVKPQVQQPPEKAVATPVAIAPTVTGPTATAPAIAATATPLTIQPLFGAARRRQDTPVDLPRRLPARFEERNALLMRMLDAPPDKANPFRSRRARLKRARLILQSIGRRFERADPWIDLSDYPHVWPELARRKVLQAA
ncbi:hypothetical protein [Erythrobacter sp. SG61-1L]|uniref:hypothetical protein n=1 Tax=Erythrobacter sp. SG61-1L TaxID=1603897 RepID=UPI00138F1CEA|nr:hypothetical protein [Erythrobacter sp. SG61-1L]